MRATDELPLGAGALAGVNFDTDRAFVASELGFGAVAAELARRRLEPRLRARLPRRRRDLRDPPLPARRGDRALVEPGVRLLRASPTRSPPARASCRRRRTPTPPSCCARRRRASRRTWSTLHGVLHGLPLTYNKDLQEDKEQLFDAVDTLELTPAVAREMLASATLRPRAHGRRRGRRVHRRHRRRRPAGAARRAVPRGARDRRRRSCARAVERGKRLSELTDGRAARARAAARRRPPRRCSSRRRGSSRRSPRAAPSLGARARAARARPAPCWRRRGRERHVDPRDFYDRPVARGRPRPGRLRRAPRRHGGPDRRDRGLPRGRARLPRLRRPHARAPSTLFGPPGTPTSTAPTASTRC